MLDTPCLRGFSNFILQAKKKKKTLKPIFSVCVCRPGWYWLLCTLYWSKVSHLNPDLTDLTRILPLPLRWWNKRVQMGHQAIQHLHGCWGGNVFLAALSPSHRRCSVMCTEVSSYWIADLRLSTQSLFRSLILFYFPCLWSSIPVTFHADISYQVHQGYFGPHFATETPEEQISIICSTW